MKTLSFDPIRADVAITEKEKSAALHANALLHNGQGAGNDFLGWVGLPSALDEEELQAIETEAARLRDLAEVILCIGIGGSKCTVSFTFSALIRSISSCLAFSACFFSTSFFNKSFACDFVMTTPLMK